MRTLPFNNWMTWPECWDSQRDAGRYTPATELSYKIPSAHCHKTVTLGCGTADEVDIFYEGQRLYVLSTNQAAEYVGLQVFEDGEEVRETFIQNDIDQCDYLLGLTPIWRVKRLADWVDE